MSSSFGGEHMSTAAVPPWIGSDCVLANCIPGSQAKSEWSELSHFWYERLPHSTWFTCLFLRGASGRSLWGQNSTWLRRSPPLFVFFRANMLKRWSWDIFQTKCYKACDLNRCVTVSFPVTQFSSAGSSGMTLALMMYDRSMMHARLASQGKLFLFGICESRR